MQKTIFNWIICALLLVIAQPSWAVEFYRCANAFGEVSFQELPCDADTLAAQEAHAADLKANRAAVESVQKDIARVKRQLMDLARYYEYGGRDLDEDETLELQASIAAERRVLQAQLNALQVRRTKLMDLLFRVSSQVNQLFQPHPDHGILLLTINRSDHERFSNSNGPAV